MVKEKKEAYLKYIQNNSPQNIIQYKRKGAVVKREVRKSQRWDNYINNIVISSQVLFHDGSLLHSNVQYTTVDYN
jgi:hypothetical protein